MSKSYFIEVSLKAALNEFSVYNLLERGQQLGFVYLDRQDYCEYLANIKKYLTINKAVESVLRSSRAQSIDDDFPSGLAIFYQDTYFLLFAYHYPERDGLKIILMSILYDWTKIYENEEYFDFGRYTKLLIDFCTDFPILDIHTRIDL